ncbi:MAG TPA: hypothetical protein VHL11_21250, partial [Phototrophicaceae bacterium]|nr:hypothetical protein [Phototrophicaceae bacterium]
GGSPGRLSDTGAAYIFIDPLLVTPTATPTVTNTSAGTNTPTATRTATPTASATNTATLTPSATSTATDTNTPTATITGTLPTDTPTFTPSVTNTPTDTVTGTVVTETFTPTVGVTGTATPTATTSAGIELLINGGFETDANTDKIPDNWIQKNPTGDKQKCNKPGKVIAYEGNCAYHFKSAPGEQSKLIQFVDLSLITPVEVNAGDTITLNGFTNAKGTVSAKIKVRVTYIDTQLETGKITVKLNAATSDYTALTGELALTLAGDPAAIKVMLQNKGTSGKVRFDAFSLLLDNAVLPLIPLP